jgi:outer membrane protein assembly factor BamB
MKSYPALGRSLAAMLTALVFAGLVLVGLGGRQKPDAVNAGEAKGDGSEWIMYGGSPSRNMANPRVKNLPVEWTVDADDRKNVKWVADLGSKSYGGPVVTGGKVFVGTNNQKPREQFIIENGNKVPLVDAKGKALDKGILMCFGEKDGAFQWQTVFHKLPSGQVHDWPLEGLCSTPVVEGDKLYYVSNRCEVVCSDVSGKIQWKLDMMGKLGVEPHNIAAGSPLILGDKVWVVTANGVNKDHINVPAPKAPSFLAVDKKSGKEVWQDNSPTASLLEANNPDFKLLINQARLIQHGQWSNPAHAVVDGQAQVVFPGGEGWIYSFDPASGKLLWKFDCNPKDAVYELGGRGTRSDFIATPVIYDNKVYIGVGQDPEHEVGVGHLWCIRMDKRGDVSPELAEYPQKGWPPKTKPNPNSALVWHYGGFVDPKDKGKIGRNYYFGRTMSTCAIHDDILYVAELAGYLHCLDAKTGKVHWTHDTRGSIWSSPYYADGKVYLGTDAGAVFVFAHGPAKKLLAENDMEGRVRATPVAANGVLYVMTENKLYAIAEKK